MKTKFMCTVLTCFSLASGISNAMDDQFGRLSITDGSQGSGSPSQITPYRGQSTSMSAYQGGHSSQSTAVDNIDISSMPSLSQTKGKVTVQFASDQAVQIDGFFRYGGTDIDGLSKFMQYIKNYPAGFVQNAPIVVKVTDDDNIKAAQFKKFFLKNLLKSYYDHHTITPELEKFLSQRDEAPFGYFNYSSNCAFFGMQYLYSMKESERGEIKDRHDNFNNFRFFYSYCPDSDREAGELMPEALTFTNGDFGYNSSGSFFAKDTVARSLSTGMSSTSAIVQLALYKLRDGQYRLYSKWSTKGIYDTNYEAKKVTNILLEIQ